MVGIVCRPDTHQKLQMLSADAQYDLACACGSNADDARRRGSEGRWIYPVTLPNGGRTVLFKTLMSNVCMSDCKYCPLRRQQDIPRCSLTPEETAKTFLDYHNQRRVFGLFLSSGLVGTPDATMDRLNTTAYLLRRKHSFKGYIHLKIIPGAGRAAIEQALSLADAVSLNIETPGEKYLARLSGKKDYIRDIVEPIKLISGLTARGCKYAKVKHTTQFIVGAAGESDAEIVKYVWGLYDRLKLHRVYFSAYQKGLGEPTIAGESVSNAGSSPTRLGDPAPPKTMPEARAPSRSQTDAFVREHRLYQVDFLIRKYGFTGLDIVFEESGNLSLAADPKEVWASRHPEAFPVDVNRAPRGALLKVPGLGPVTVGNILTARRAGRIAGIEDIGRPSLTSTRSVGSRLEKARKYLSF